MKKIPTKVPTCFARASLVHRQCSKKAKSFLETTINESKDKKPNKTPSAKQRGRPRGKKNTSVGSGKDKEPSTKRGRGRLKGAKNKNPKVAPTAKPSRQLNKAPKVIDTDLKGIKMPNATFIPVQHDPELSISKIFDLLDLCPGRNEITGDFHNMAMDNMQFIFNRVLNRHGGRHSDMIRHRLAIELDPDPFKRVSSGQKWLSSVIMDYYGWYLNDETVHTRENVYYLSSMARYSYVQAGYDAFRSIPSYIRHAHTQIQYSMLTDVDELAEDHTPETCLRVAGDPLMFKGHHLYLC